MAVVSVPYQLRGIHPLINRLPPRSTTAIFAFHPSTRVPDICYFNYFAEFYCRSCLFFFFSSFSWIPRLVVASVRAQCLLPFKLVNDRERAKLWFEIALEYRRPKRIMVIEREKFFPSFSFLFSRKRLRVVAGLYRVFALIATWNLIAAAWSIGRGHLQE